MGLYLLSRDGRGVPFLVIRSPSLSRKYQQTSLSPPQQHDDLFEAVNDSCNEHDSFTPYCSISDLCNYPHYFEFNGELVG